MKMLNGSIYNEFKEECNAYHRHKKTHL